jgi:hypothetical protein
MTPATIAAALLAPTFLLLWLGASTGTKSAPVACILLFGLWANTFGKIAYSHLQATGRPDLISKLFLAELPPYFVMLFLGMRWMGLSGAALAWSARCVGDAIGLFLLDAAPVPSLGRLTAQAVLVGIAIITSLEVGPWSISRLALFFLLSALGLALVWRDRPADLARLLRINVAERSVRGRPA